MLSDQVKELEDFKQKHSKVISIYESTLRSCLVWAKAHAEPTNDMRAMQLTIELAMNKIKEIQGENG